MADERRFLVLRVPSSGPKALAGGENDFDSLEAAQARVADILGAQLKTHHTSLEIMDYSGDRRAALVAAGVLY